jgi:hypothetical protein
MSTPVGKITVNCWPVRIPDSYQAKPPLPCELTSLKVEPKGDSGIVRTDLANELRANLQFSSLSLVFPY